MADKLKKPSALHVNKVLSMIMMAKGSGSALLEQVLDHVGRVRTLEDALGMAAACVVVYKKHRNLWKKEDNRFDPIHAALEGARDAYLLRSQDFGGTPIQRYVKGGRVVVEIEEGRKSVFEMVFNSVAKN